MKYFILSTAFILIIVFTANSQITKGNWMVGGNGVFASQTQNLGSINPKGINIKLSPNIGYFFIDKFSGGIKSGIIFNQVKYNGGVSKSTQFSCGPYFRYYFLSEENRVNLFTESSYQYSHNYSNSGTSDNQNAFAISFGPVIYFNTVVGLEFTISYEYLKSVNTNTSAKTFYLGVGFQIHLERDKN